ncbi:pyrroline-5-carboxylate reductase [Malassezia pachydermatis]|uniref:Pyrroline-5-carboxylate reductase n=1 Tax=Malassezia pachydermatis TaxID=77020 RepID=A0A0M8MJY4_9BASI|nr:pyrroline-5-carboxylate reductase [Malassezia pachydermatis]KOS13068.1 pyrroline-5-carboxylate reductase [Malassezia pachydermatis]
MASSQTTLAVLACGTMGSAILSGVMDTIKARVQNETPVERSVSSLASETNTDAPLPTRYITTVGRSATAKRLERLFAHAGYENVEILVQNNVEAAKQGDIVLLCCKPQRVTEFLSEEGMREALEGKILVSIVAGITSARLATMVGPTTKVVRAMPNTPSKIREGMTVISNEPHLSQMDRDVLASIFSAVGTCRFLDEKYFDAATALAGSGPAFVALFLEAMADGGVMMGLPRPEALELAAQTMQGAARMVLQTGMHPAAIKDSVTTPGGCTIAGLLQMEDGNLRSTVARTIQTAAEHAAGLGKISQ